jgi:hypothetical protein
VAPDDRLPPALLDARLVRADGSEVAVSALLDGRPLLLLFIRHFGCVSCADQVEAILPRLAELAELGVRAVLVGNGPPEHVAGFLERHGLDEQRAEVLTDPSLASFRAAGLQRSWWATFGPRAVADFLRAVGRGSLPRGTDGDLTQQGGAFLTDGTRAVVWSHRNPSMGAHADPSDIVEAALRVRLARADLVV